MSLWTLAGCLSKISGARYSGPKVHKDQTPIGLAHDVLGLDVSVEQASVVNGAERSTDLDANIYGRNRRKWTVGSKDVLQRATLDELHRESHTPCDRIRVVNRDDVWMPDARKKPALFDEIRSVSVGVSLSGSVKEFEGDVAIKPGVSRTIHLAVRSAPYLFNN